MTRRFVATASVVLLLFAACSSDDDGQRTGAARATPTPAPTPCALDGGSTQAQASSTQPEWAPLSDLRHSTDGCPRIVFEFAGHEPDYRVEYATGPFSECGSGEEVSTAGWDAGAFLRVRLEPSGTADLSDPAAKQTYTGPRDIEVDGRVLKHMKVICDFEAVLEWVIGLDEERDFAVVVLDDPSRIVVDVSES